MTQRMPTACPHPGTPTIIDDSEAVASVDTVVLARRPAPSADLVVRTQGARGGAVAEASLALIRDVWGSLLDVTAAVVASSQAATAAYPLTDEEERLRGEVPGTSASPRSLVEAGR